MSTLSTHVLDTMHGRPAAGMAVTLSGADGEGIWSVRYRPQGMSGGITLWGRPSAFTLPDGTPLQSQRAEY